MKVAKYYIVSVLLCFFCSLLFRGEVMAFELKSSAFENNAAIPVKYTCDNVDISPPLKWEGAPQNTQSFVLICDDPDAPVGTWVHWVIYGIPKNTNNMPEGVPKKETLDNGAKQGLTDFKKIGYGGPCPPPGKPHRYFFKLYALDTQLNLPTGATKAQVEKVMQGHIIGQTQLIGLYKR